MRRVRKTVEMATAFLKDRSLGRIFAGHPWVFAGDVLRVEKPPPDGGEITLRTAAGDYVGNGFFNSKSQIPVRILSRSKEKLDAPFFRNRLLAAQKLRETTRSGEASNPSSSPAYRLVWSEADFLPGLIVDRYGDAWVIQTMTLAMEQRKSLIVDLLKEIFQPSVIVERNDVAARRFEGLELEKGFLLGEAHEKRVITLGKARLELDLLGGQKTGAYLDQITNQMDVGELARGRRVLDCFTYHGGFALHAASGGAAAVEAVDISEEAVAQCRRNAELNDIKSIQWKAANVFDELNSRQRSAARFDLIILDPPSFTKSRARLTEALAGYKEIHLRAFKLLAPGGLLATFCCSHHVDAETFRAVALDAAFDARKILRLRRTFSQPPDHPIIPAIPETEYLKGFLFELV